MTATTHFNVGTYFANLEEVVTDRVDSMVKEMFNTQPTKLTTFVNQELVDASRRVFMRYVDGTHYDTANFDINTQPVGGVEYTLTAEDAKSLTHDDTISVGCAVITIKDVTGDSQLSQVTFPNLVVREMLVLSGLDYLNSPNGISHIDQKVKIGDDCVVVCVGEFSDEVYSKLIERKLIDTTTLVYFTGNDNGLGDAANILTQVRKTHHACSYAAAVVKFRAALLKYARPKAEDEAMIPEEDLKRLVELFFNVLNLKYTVTHRPGFHGVVRITPAEDFAKDNLEFYKTMTVRAFLNTIAYEHWKARRDLVIPASAEVTTVVGETPDGQLVSVKVVKDETKDTSSTSTESKATKK